MAVPFRRISKTSKRMRRTHYKLKLKGVSICEHCGEMIRPHIVCPKCGYYDGKAIIEVKSKKTEE